jgi:hypothetical protein
MQLVFSVYNEVLLVMTSSALRIALFPARAFARWQGRALLLLATASFAISPRPASAALVQGFTSNFSPSFWTPSPEASVIDTTTAPAAITLSGSDGGSGSEIFHTYSIGLYPDQYAVGFNWDYNSTDRDASSDIFGYMLNTTDFTPLSDPLGGLQQTGYIKLTLAPTDTFGFAIRSTDDLGGSASVRLSGFLAGVPGAIPDCEVCPGPLPLLGIGVAFAQSRRLRERQRSMRIISVQPVEMAGA